MKVAANIFLALGSIGGLLMFAMVVSKYAPMLARSVRENPSELWGLLLWFGSVGSMLLAVVFRSLADSKERERGKDES